MSKNNRHINYEDIIARYLAGETDRQEVNLLEKWVKENSDNQKLFIQHKRAWQHTQNPESYRDRFDPDEAWNQVESELFSKEKTGSPKIIKLKPVYRIAAAVAALITIGYFVFYLMQINNGQTLVASNEILIETLADGTKVTLNRNSILSFPKKFKKNERRVELSGDAFFDVARNPEKPFIVESGEISVEVLGTSFYINAKQEQKKVEVTVKTGKVLLKSDENKLLELVAGEKGIFDKNNKSLTKISNTNVNFLAWKTKRMMFEDAPLTEVIQVLEKAYNVKIHIVNPAIGRCTLTATFNQLGILDVLDIIQETFPTISYTGKGNTYTLNGTKCEE